MRLLMDTVIVLMLLVILSAVLWHKQNGDDRQLRVDAVRQAIEAIHSKALYHAAIGDVDAEPNGFPTHIEPTWFTRPPDNALLHRKTSPWLDTAEGDDRTRQHPRSIVSETGEAAFWYNPHKGIVRARVPMQITRDQTLSLYNEVNSSALAPDQVDWTHIEGRIVARDHGAGSLVEDAHQPDTDPLPDPLPDSSPATDPARRLNELLQPRNPSS